ncbi:MAG TPA: hypothetical protein VK814_18885 [Acidobacteriaceae bacterium]|nr:hypothetical protein [Acidobacteriaceae bacterium]
MTTKTVLSKSMIAAGILSLVGLAGCRHTDVRESLAMATTAPDFQEIHVNKDCLILQDQVDGVVGASVPGAKPVGGGAPGASGQRAVAQLDSTTCHLDSQLTANRVKGEVVNGAVQRSVVVVNEKDYLLQNGFERPVVFVVEQPVPEGWQIASVPGPDKMLGNVALFKAVALPGQMVRLHAGQQHTITLAE